MSGESKSTMRALGEFFGHVWKGVAANPAKPALGGDRVVRQEVQEEVREGGKVKLRRTIVEEVIVDPEAPKA